MLAGLGKRRPQMADGTYFTGELCCLQSLSPYCSTREVECRRNNSTR